MKKIFLIILILLCLTVIIRLNWVNAQESSLPQPLMQPAQLVPTNKTTEFRGNTKNIPNCPTNMCPPLPQQGNKGYNNNYNTAPPNAYSTNNNRPPQGMQQVPPNRQQIQPPGQQIPPQNMNDGPQNVLIILDSSYSMEEKIGKDRKIDIAKRVVFNTVKQIPPNTRVGLRVYGHKIGLMGIYPCRKTELLVPIGFNTANQIITRLSYINPTGQTPIAYSIKTAVDNDFIGINGPKRIILVSDGMETCDGDPCSYAVEMVRRGIDLKVDVVGFDLKDEAAINQLKCIALSTEGKFYTADTEAALARSLQNSFQVKTQVQGKILLNK